MKFLVNGVEYKDYNEALKAEELANSKNDILNNMKLFTVSKEDVIFLTIAVVTRDNHSEYAKVLANDYFGSQYSINERKQLIKNYTVSECLDRGVVERTAIGVIRGKEYSKFRYFNNLDCEKDTPKEEYSSIDKARLIKLFEDSVLL